MKMWVINKSDFSSFDQLYNINSFGKVVDLTPESLKEHYISSNLCFIVENLIEVDSNTIVPVLDSISGYLETNPVYKTIKGLNRVLETPIENNVIASLIFKVGVVPSPLNKMLNNNIPSIITSELNTVKLAGIKDTRQFMQILFDYRYSRIPDSYLIEVLSALTENNYLNQKIIDLFIKIAKFIDRVQEIKNEKRF